MSHKNKFAMCGHVHVEGIDAGVVEGSGGESACRINGRW
jgi:hypothetical protein